MPTIFNQEIHELKEFIDRSGRGTRGNFIYILRRNKAAIYVGKTAQPVEKRIRQHIWQKDVIGTFLQLEAPAYEGWTVELLHVDYDLDTVERDTIKTLQPTINREGK